jgi:hypothetical protein
MVSQLGCVDPAGVNKSREKGWAENFFSLNNNFV